MPGCDEDISLKHDGDLSDSEFYRQLALIFSDIPRWGQLLILGGLVIVMAVGAVICIPLILLDLATRPIRRK